MDSSTDLLFMEPVFHGKIWGGRKLEEMYGYEIPDGPVGECWGTVHGAGLSRQDLGRP